MIIKATRCCCVLLWLVTQSCLTLFSPMVCRPPGSSVPMDPGVGCHALLQGIFPTQGSNPGLPHSRQILYHLSYQGSLRITGMGSLPLLQENFLTEKSNGGLLHYRQILYQLSYQGSIRVLQNLLRFSRWVWRSRLAFIAD